MVDSKYGSVPVFDGIESSKEEFEDFGIEINNSGDRVQSLSTRLVRIAFIILVIVVSIVYYSSIETLIRNDSTFSNSENKNQKPNFVFILADDLSFSSIGHPIDIAIAAVTPTLTSLARSGIIMNNFYSQEVCTPARSSLLTGRYPISVGSQYGVDGQGIHWGLNATEILLPQALSSSGYTSYVYGKWDIGYVDPIYLPTSRGFSEFIGYLLGQNFYWSKHYPGTTDDSYVDFTKSNTSCFSPYNTSDMNEYSTFFYTNKSLEIIDKHAQADDNTNPFFLYLALQNVHSPFFDILPFDNLTTDSYVPNDILSIIHTHASGNIRREYLKSLYLLDQAVASIYTRLIETGVMDNTYIIFQSDNGGCLHQGGTVQNLRGTKGSLFEGGTKVDSFIFSPLLNINEANGKSYNNLMHTSDWFPTILSLAGIEYTPEEANTLDGVSHAKAWFVDTEPAPRTNMVYNIYTNIHGLSDMNILTDASCAVRNERYKLIHAYDDLYTGGWHWVDEEYTNDDLKNLVECDQTSTAGTFTYWLFDLLEDPYEITNLFDSDLIEHVTAKAELYDLLQMYVDRTAVCYIVSGLPTSNTDQSILENYIFPYSVNSDVVESLNYCPLA